MIQKETMSVTLITTTSSVPGSVKRADYVTPSTLVQQVISEGFMGGISPLPEKVQKFAPNVDVYGNIMTDDQKIDLDQ